MLRMAFLLAICLPHECPCIASRLRSRTSLEGRNPTLSMSCKGGDLRMPSVLPATGQVVIGYNAS